jgi:hypothetical protein
MSENVGASTSRNPKGLNGLYRDNLAYLTSAVLAVERSVKEEHSVSIFRV